MGCFLACYGIPKKQRRRRFSNRVAAAAAGDYRRRSYVALDSSTLTLIENDESEQFRDKAKQATSKVRKKVTFNLNVQIFEPSLKDYEFVEEEADEKEQEVAKRRLSTTKFTRASTALPKSIGIFPSNYRYQNVRDSCDSFEEEEDYVADEDTDYDDEDYYSDDDYYSDGDSSSDMDDPRLSEEGYVNQSLSATTNGESEPCAHSVLSPIESLSQWKAAKAKTVAPKQQKENVAPSFQEPNFLYSRSSCNQSKPLQLRQTSLHDSLSSWVTAK